MLFSKDILSKHGPEGFHDNQYDGRRGRQPQSAVLNKVLSLDIIRYYGEPSAMVENDAITSYNRILPYLTTYMLRRHVKAPWDALLFV